MPTVPLRGWSRWLREHSVTQPVATRFAAVTGRFQPFHLGHLELVRIAAGQCDQVIIGITNPDPGSWHEHADSQHRHLRESNPFTYWQRHRMIEATLHDVRAEGWLPQGGWTIVPFPLDRPGVWFDYIPRDALQFVRAFSDWERSKAQALSAGGYEVTLLDGDPGSAIRASAIRATWAQGEAAENDLPEPVRQAIRAMRVNSAFGRASTAVSDDRFETSARSAVT